MFVRWRSTVFSRQHEVGGDLARGAGLGDQLDDLHLARGERVVGRRLAAAGALDEVAHQRAHGARVQERLAAHRRPAGLHQVAVGDALEHVAGGARAQGLEQVLLVVVHREDQHAQVVAAARELARGLQAGHARHRHVEHGEVDVVVRGRARPPRRRRPTSATTFRSGSPSSTSRRPRRTTSVVVGEHDAGLVHAMAAPG